MAKKLIFPILAIFIAIAACSTPTPVPAGGGVVQGVVYADLNGDGSLSAAEEAGPKVDNATVTLADCGPTQSQLTDADGGFRFENLPAGSCHVTVAKAGWVFSGSYPNLGYPFPVASDPSLPSSFSLYMAPVMEITPTDTPTPIPATSIPMPTFTPIPATSIPTPTLTLSPVPTTPMVTPLRDAVNCRFGPGMTYLTVGALRVGETVPILATIVDHSWWKIANPLEIGQFCWVSAAATQTFGDLSLVPVVPIPGGLVIEVTVDPMGDIVGYCHEPNAFSPHGAITTNGPATVVYHWEIWRNGSLFHATADETLVFASASTQMLDPGADRGDCGNYTVKLLVTSPNNKSAEQSFTITG